MKDTYPQNFALEIDREALAEYKKAQSLLSLALALGGISVLVGLFLFGGLSERGLWHGWPMGLLALFLSVLACFVVAMALTWVSHITFGRRNAEEFARTLEVRVEGPFLVIREGNKYKTDRKLHFRAIVDYTVIEDWMMSSHGVKALSMTTTSSAQQPVKIHGLKNCEQVRDQLAEIDAMREFG